MSDCSLVLSVFSVFSVLPLLSEPSGIFTRHREILGFSQGFSRSLHPFLWDFSGFTSFLNSVNCSPCLPISLSCSEFNSQKRQGILRKTPLFTAFSCFSKIQGHRQPSFLPGITEKHASDHRDFHLLKSGKHGKQLFSRKTSFFDTRFGTVDFTGALDLRLQ